MQTTGSTGLSVSQHTYTSSTPFTLHCYPLKKHSATQPGPILLSQQLYSSRLKIHIWNTCVVISHIYPKCISEMLVKLWELLLQSHLCWTKPTDVMLANQFKVNHQDPSQCPSIGFRSRIKQYAYGVNIVSLQSIQVKEQSFGTPIKKSFIVSTKLCRVQIIC